MAGWKDELVPRYDVSILLQDLTVCLTAFSTDCSNGIVQRHCMLYITYREICSHWLGFEVDCSMYIRMQCISSGWGPNVYLNERAVHMQAMFLVYNRYSFQ